MRRVHGDETRMKKRGTEPLIRMVYQLSVLQCLKRPMLTNYPTEPPNCQPKHSSGQQKRASCANPSRKAQQSPKLDVWPLLLIATKTPPSGAFQGQPRYVDNWTSLRLIWATKTSRRPKVGNLTKGTFILALQAARDGSFPQPLLFRL